MGAGGGAESTFRRLSESGYDETGRERRRTKTVCPAKYTWMAQA
eukprot:COSAG06_NODE_30932_length_529_cov_59.844186_2_plen_43_part_01